ncbi:hypothetical protein G3142_002307 [Salmonella enterica subsp. enterica serovar Montevideo]|nr:hypothetical protein [Salmonella enterica subsp. enterica serovar Montevideo]EEK7814011.1 hypothetical protein [Salmonella enterica subsp. enterica serovar Montevideo]
MTQPARKKETATQLELLEAELTAARKVTARYRSAMEAHILSMAPSYLFI